jgi:ribosome biogenesis GTPase
VIVLTKADAAAPGAIAAALEAIRGRIPPTIDLVIVDARSPDAAALLAPHLGAGRTLVLLGSSGAGKSTLTNTLTGRSAQDTGPVREQDSRGKHTTTARSLHRLPGGACVIDTPGLRTLRPDADEAAIGASFGDIERPASACRFRDCRHVEEPGCAVRASVAPDRLRNFHKLLREVRRDTMGALQRRQQVAHWKARSRAGRERLKAKREGG